MTTSLATLRTKSVDGENRTLCGRNYIAISVVALVEGVRHAGGSPEPELVMADAFGRHVETWNGRPIVVNHPVNAKGKAVLASSKDVLDSSYLGELMNSKIDNGKLIVEAWLDLGAISTSKSKTVKAMWKRLVDGETVEVSVGAIVYTLDEEGEYDGKAYSGRWDVVIPDHLAFLDGGQIGACSVEDGCGTFRSYMSGKVKLSEGVRMAARSAIKTISASEPPAEIKHAGSDCTCNKDGKSASCTCNTTTTVAASTTEVDQSNEETLPEGARSARAIARALFSSEVFDIDKRALISRALSEKFGYGHYVVAYSDNVVVYEKYENGKFCLYQLDYTHDKNNLVKLSDADPTEVVIQIKTVPVPEDTSSTSDKNNGKEKAMAGETTKEKTVAEMLADVETLDDLSKALDGTPLGKRLNSALHVAAAVRKKAVAVILSSPVGKKQFKEADLQHVDFPVLDGMARAFAAPVEPSPRAAAAGGTTETEEVEDTNETDDEADEMQFGYMGYDTGSVALGRTAGVDPDIASRTAARNGAGGNGNVAPMGNSRKKQAVAGNFVARAGGGGRAAAASDIGIGGAPLPPSVFDFDNGKAKA